MYVVEVPSINATLGAGAHQRIRSQVTLTFTASSRLLEALPSLSPGQGSRQACRPIFSAHFMHLPAGPDAFQPRWLRLNWWQQLFGGEDQALDRHALQVNAEKTVALGCLVCVTMYCSPGVRRRCMLADALTITDQHRHCFGLGKQTAYCTAPSQA